MKSVKRVRKTDLARQTRQVIRAAQQGQTAIVESHGQPEVAITDILDYRILLAVLHYYGRAGDSAVASELADERVAAASSPQERFNLVIGRYLGGAISLSRAAELLEVPWLALRTRFLRLEIPLRAAPRDKTEIEADIAAAVSPVDLPQTR